MKENKETHDLAISAMSPTYCRKCNKSGYELSETPCKFATPTQEKCLHRDDGNMSNPKCLKCGIYLTIVSTNTEDWNKLQDEFMEFWDSHKDSLGLGEYSDAITQFWFNKLQQQKERILREVEGLRQRETFTHPRQGELRNVRAEGFNQALDKVKELITKTK